VNFVKFKILSYLLEKTFMNMAEHFFLTYENDKN
jgi:hypothetical protein